MKRVRQSKTTGDPTGTDARPRHRNAFRVAAVALGLLVALAGVEIVFWLLPPGHPLDNPWYLRFDGSEGVARPNSPRLPYSRPAHFSWTGRSRGDLSARIADPDARTVTFQTDFQGFRNSRDLQSADVVFLGDSFTEAGNVAESETFAALVGQQLNRTVRNLGCAGYGPPHELVVLQEYALPCRPQFIVWQISENNDLPDSLAYERWLAMGQEQYEPTPRSRAASWKERSLLYRAWDALRPGQSWPLEGDFVDAEQVTHQLRFELIPPNATLPRRHAGWPAMREALFEGWQNSLAATPSARMVIVLIPTKIRVMGPFTTTTVTTAPHFAESIIQAAQNSLGAALATLCQELNIPFLDLTGVLRDAAARGEVVYLPLDTHLSPRGHEIVAAAIAELIGSMDRAP